MNIQRAFRCLTALMVASGLALASVFASVAPALAAPENTAIVISSPANDSRLQGAPLVVSGTAPAGSVLTYFVPGTAGTVSETLTVNQDNTFTTREFAVVPELDPQPFLFGFTGVTSGGEPIYGDAINLYPATMLPAPVIAAPASGATVLGDSVIFHGTATPGEKLVVTLLAVDDAASRESAPVLVNPNGEWEAKIEGVRPGEYNSSAALVYTAGGATTYTSAHSTNVAITIAPLESIVITSPTQGETIDSQFVTFAGTAPIGATLFYGYEGDDGEVPLAVDASGIFSVTFLVGRDNSSYPITLFVQGYTAESAPLSRVTVDFFTLPYLPAPAITSPADGSTVAGDSMTFTGTGVAGEKAVVSIHVPGLALGEFEKYSRTSPQVVIDAQGNWTTSIDNLLPATYTVTALLVYAEDGSERVISDFAPYRWITLQAGTPLGGKAPVLAATGNDASSALGLSALLLFAGGALIVARRRIST